MKAAEGKGDSPMSNSTPASGMGTEVKYNFDGKKFSRISKIVDQELFKKSLDSTMQGAEAFLGQSSYTFIYHFPKEIKSTNIETGIISEDGKTLTYEVSLMDAMTKPEEIKIEVELK